jgi:hypothetical protein
MLSEHVVQLCIENDTLINHKRVYYGRVLNTHFNLFHIYLASAIERLESTGGIVPIT